MDFLHEKEQYPFVLHHKPGFFLSWVLYTLFKHVQFAQDMAETLRQMHRQGTVVYAIKYRGHLDYLLYHYRFRSSRLPYPKIAFDMNISLLLPISHFIKVLKFQIFYFIKNRRLPNPFETGFFKKSIQQGTPALLCLVDPKGFLRHFIHSEKDNIHFLLETQKDMEKPIFIVPQLILYKMTSEKAKPNLRDILFGFKDKPGTIRKIALFFRYNRRAFIDFGKPINLKTYLEDQSETRSFQDMAAELKQMLIEGIDVQKRVILGPVMKSRQQLKEIVLEDKEVIREIEKKASANKNTLKGVRKQADKIFNEIAADYNSAYIQFFYVALTWLWKRIYQGIDVDKEGLSVVREWARKGSLVFVPSHKSHIDYLVLNYILYENHIHIPRTAAGQNLAFWPMGHVFRKSGAFFIRRTFKGTSLYPRIFARYVRQLLEEGHPLEFFIEGGRSRSGKLILPKTGFLSILLEAYEKGCSEELAFVPASISYDSILEEKAYLNELGGGKKEKESFKQILSARHFLKRKHGKIYIRFGQPISLKNYLAQKGVSIHSASKLLAFDLTRAINKITLVTPLALIATSILTRHRRGFQVHELIATAQTFLSFINRYDIPKATSLDNFNETIEEVLSILVSRKVIDLLEQSDEKEVFYYVYEEKKKELEYYKNSIIQFFISHSFLAVCLLTGTEAEKTDDDIFPDYNFLRNLFKYEFVYNDGEDIQKEIERAMADFLELSYITKSSKNRGYLITRIGYDELPTWAALTKTFLESYWIAARTYLQLDEGSRMKSDLLKRMNQLGVRYQKLGFIDHVEGISKISFENAIRFIKEDILGPEGESEEERLSVFGQRLYDLSHY